MSLLKPQEEPPDMLGQLGYNVRPSRDEPPRLRDRKQQQPHDAHGDRKIRTAARGANAFFLGCTSIFGVFGVDNSRH